MATINGTKKKNKNVYNMRPGLSPGSLDLCNLYQLSFSPRDAGLGCEDTHRMQLFWLLRMVRPWHRQIARLAVPRAWELRGGSWLVVRLVQLRWGWIEACWTASTCE